MKEVLEAIAGMVPWLTLLGVLLFLMLEANL